MGTAFNETMDSALNEAALRIKSSGTGRIQKFPGGIIGLNWPKLDDLTWDDKEDIEKKFQREYPEYDRRSAAQHVGNICRFVNIAEGEPVVLITDDGIVFALAIEKYHFVPGVKDYPHCVKVRYIADGEPVLWRNLPSQLGGYKHVGQYVFGTDDNDGTIYYVINTKEKYWPHKPR